MTEFPSYWYNSKCFVQIHGEDSISKINSSEENGGVPVFQPPTLVTLGKLFYSGGGGLLPDRTRKTKPNRLTQIMCSNPKKSQYRPITDILSQQTPKQTLIRGNFLELCNACKAKARDYRADLLGKFKVSKFLLNIIVFDFDTLFERTAFKRYQRLFT